MFDHILLQPDMTTFNISILQALVYQTNDVNGQVESLQNLGYSEKSVTRILRKVSYIIWFLLDSSEIKITLLSWFVTLCTDFDLFR